MSTRLHIVVSDELLARIDAAAGDVPRSRWVRRVIERALDGRPAPVVVSTPAGRLEAEAARLEAVRRIRAAGASEEELVAALERAGVAESSGVVEQALGEQPSGQADAPVPAPAERPEEPEMVTTPEVRRRYDATMGRRPVREFRPYPKGGG